jgi:G3E family GTPase
MDKMNEWLGELLKEKGADIYRMKGVLAIQGEANKFVFQGIHMLFDGKPLTPWVCDFDRATEVAYTHCGS